MYGERPARKRARGWQASRVGGGHPELEVDATRRGRRSPAQGRRWGEGRVTSRRDVAADAVGRAAGGPAGCSRASGRRLGTMRLPRRLWKASASSRHDPRMCASFLPRFCMYRCDRAPSTIMSWPNSEHDVILASQPVPVEHFANDLLHLESGVAVRASDQCHENSP